MVPPHRTTQQEAGGEMPSATQNVLSFLRSISTDKPVASPAPPAWSWGFSWTWLPQASFHLETLGPVTQTWETHRELCVNLAFMVWASLRKAQWGPLPSRPDNPLCSVSSGPLGLTVSH